MKKISISIFTIIIVTVLSLAACSNNSGKQSNDEEGKLSIEIWHAMSGDNGKNFQEIVDDFNDKSDEILVKAVYQGSYDDLLTKVRAVGGSDKAPALIQSSETSRLFLAESDFITPVQEFIDEEDFDTSNFESNALNTYIINDKLYSMPFSTSNPMMYYNKDMFEEAGLDPDDPPLTFEAYEKVSQTIKDETGNVGFSMATVPFGWFFEELLANQDALFLDNDNGFSDKATKTLLNEEPGQKIFTWINNMIESETLENYGSDWEDPRSAFLAEQLAMYFDSSANAREMVDAASGSFEVGTTRLPVPEGIEPNGAFVGGNATYITNKVSKEEQEAGWEFVKYSVTKEVQAKWNAATGYFPVNKEANDESVLSDVYEEYPQMLTAVEVNSNTSPSPSTGAALFEHAQQTRDIMGSAYEDLFKGEDPIKILEEATEKINDLIED